LYGKIGFFFWISILISVTVEKWSYTSYLFFTPEKEIAPLVKWSLRLPYTFLSVGSPFIEEEGKMP
jgi:hypothetical protein